MSQELGDAVEERRDTFLNIDHICTQDDVIGPPEFIQNRCYVTLVPPAEPSQAQALDDRPAACTSTSEHKSPHIAGKNCSILDCKISDCYRTVQYFLTLSEEVQVCKAQASNMTDKSLSTWQHPRKRSNVPLFKDKCLQDSEKETTIREFQRGESTSKAEV